MKVKYIGQQGIKDCAVSCLYNIIRYYKGNISMDSLREMLNTDDSGTSVYSIVEVSKKVGLVSNAYKCEINDLCNLKLPLIAHIKVEGKYEHYIIIDKIKDDILYVYDPIRGYIKYDFDSFEKEWSNIVITFDKTDDIINEKKDSNFKKIFNYLKNNSKYIYVFVTLSILASILSVFHSFYLSYLYDNYSKITSIFIIFTLICISKVIIDYIRNIIILKYNKKLDISLTNKTYNNILSLPLKYHHNRPVGDIVSRINDLSSIKEFINVVSFSFIIDLIYILIICIILFVINKLIFLILLIMVIIYILIYLSIRNNIRNSSMINKENNSCVNTYLVESILGIDTIKNLNIEENIKSIFENKYNNFLKSNFSLNKTLLNFESIQDFISVFTCIIILFVGIILSHNKMLSISYLFSLNTLIIYIFISLKNVITLDNLIIESKNSYKRLKSLSHQLISDIDCKNIEFKDSIEFKKLHYSYSNKKTLLNINFKIDKGDYIFIKGKSGTGKSTIFKILTKQLSCDDNMVKIDGIDINKLSMKDINNNICYVSQNEFIFTDSLLNNIKLFKEARKEELDKVIKITNIDKILKERNITLDFLLEENGHNLSGGERQRILLARSLLRNKKILVLDETMNELDVESEREIIKKINAEYDLTLILISHRDNNSDLFNKIIKIDGGKNEEIKCK